MPADTPEGSLPRRFMNLVGLGFAVTLACAPSPPGDGPVEFCLRGELDIGLRNQGHQPGPGEWVPTNWCVITEPDSQRVLYSATGRVNSDMDNSWAVAYLPPDTVRILNSDSPDVEFQETDNLDEALRVRRLDPRRLAQELLDDPHALEPSEVEVADGRVMSVHTTADLPLRGTVPVIWRWDWSDEARPKLRLELDGELLFRATGTWRELEPSELESHFERPTQPEPIEVPPGRWPARVEMSLFEVGPGVHLVRGVRTGFQHLVVDTHEGLVVVDAPAGWVEFHQLPPADLVPGLGVSGLSEGLIDFLSEQLPGRPVVGVVLTHFHDDHAGGARAFAAAGATIHADADASEFLRSAFDSQDSQDRLAASGARVPIQPVGRETTLGTGPNGLTLLPMGPNPHTTSMLGVLVPRQRLFFVSDVHVPRDELDRPAQERAETECWFARWATTHLEPDVEVHNSHSPVITPVARLQAYLASPTCSEEADL